MKTFLIGGAAAVALASIAPAVAQPAAQTQAPREAKVHSRADVQAKVAEHFARIDTNRDGFVTTAEAEAVRGQMRARIAERRDQGGSRAFDRLDANSDGSISRAEFDARREQRVEQRQKRAGDGKRRGGGHRMGMIGGRMFEMADANKDGRVALQEAQAMALRHFDMADANRDGQITRDERRQMHQRMRNERTPG